MKDTALKLVILMASGFLGHLIPPETMEGSLPIFMAGFMVIGLYASMLYPNAGFDATEKWQRLALNMFPIFILGYTGVSMWHSQPLGIIPLVLCCGAIFAITSSGVASRKHDIDMFVQTHPHLRETVALVGLLNTNRLHKLAVLVTQAAMRGENLYSISHPTTMDEATLQQWGQASTEITIGRTLKSMPNTKALLHIITEADRIVLLAYLANPSSVNYEPMKLIEAYREHRTLVVEANKEIQAF